jgi:hypothetical protein
MTTLEQLDSELKVRIQPRPRYSCEKCHSNFPSILDLSEHIRVDHSRTNNDDRKKLFFKKINFFLDS